MPSNKTQFIFELLEHSSGVGASSFASVMHFDPGDRSGKGELHISAVINSPDARIEREIRNLIEQKYFMDERLSTFEALVAAVGEVVHLFNQRQILIELSAIAYVENLAYLVAANGSQVIVIRDGSVVPVLSSEEAEVKGGSGYIHEGDIIITATPNLSEVVGLEKLQRILDEVNDVEELHSVIVEELAGYKKPLSFCVTNIHEEVVEEQEEYAVNIPKSSSKSKVRSMLAASLDQIIGIIPERKIQIKNEADNFGKPDRSKIPVFVGAGLLVALLVSIFFGVRARETQQKRAEYEDELVTAQHQFEEARSLSGIDSARAKDLILSAKKTVDDLSAQGIEDNDLQVLGASIEQNLGGIAGIYSGESNTFLDLSLIRADFLGSDLAFSEGVIRVLDSESTRMTLIDAESKKTENIGELDLLPNSLQAAAYGSESFILSSDGIREVQDDLTLVVKDEDWRHTEVLIGSFGGNLYVLDKGNNTIWRYPRGATSFGDGQVWFAPGINVNVTDAVSWAIDGKVWILTSVGEVDVYERGLPQRFVMEGVATSSGYKQIFTDENSEFVYLLDQTESRIIVLQKDGKYKGEYQSDKLADAVDFVVSEEDGKIVYLSENKLWEIPLKH